MILNQLGKRNLNPNQASYYRGLLYNSTKKSDTKFTTENQPTGGKNFLSSTAQKIAQETGVTYKNKFKILAEKYRKQRARCR